MGSIYKLIIEDDDGKTTVVPLKAGDVSIGRMDGNTIRLMERNVSRRHARLLRENGSVFIEDLSSFNGVKINGERIDQRLEVKEGDLVEIGDYHLALQKEEAVDAGPVDARSSRSETLNDLRSSEAGASNGLVDRRTHPILPPFPPGLGSAGNPLLSGMATVPDSPLARTEPIKVGPAPTADVPRIVCVSTEYAGREFALNRPEVILGRVDENDIVIEHRSVSRNHAKILFDGRVHKIIDLESANGILVNGEEYAITDLRKDDVIELGHVRFRFIPAGEAFLPTEEETRAMLEAGVVPVTASLARPISPLSFPEHPFDEEVTAQTEFGRGTSEIQGLVSADPSMAATVTDVPLSALNVPAMFDPQIEAITARPAERPPRARRATSTSRAGTRTKDRSSTSADTMEETVDAPDGREKVFAAAVIILLLLAGVVYGGSRLVGGPDDARDREIKLLFEQGDFAEVERFYLQNDGQFADKQEALRLVVEAKTHGDQAPPQPSPVEPTPKTLPEGVPPAEAAAPRVEERPSAEPAVAEAGTPAKSATKARQFELRGRTALLAGDMENAERFLKLCLKAAPYPDCHRGLGILYASRDDPKLAIRHYRKYVELKPEAADAEKVRALIRQAGGEQ